MSLISYTKDPAAVLDYGIDWSDYLEGDTIASSSWTIPAGITQVTASFSAIIATVRLSGGTHGTDYECLNHVVTTTGQEDERSITIQVRQVEAGATRDASDRANAITQLYEMVQINAAPVLTAAEVDAILNRNRIAATWTSTTLYYPGDKVIPTVKNGHYYIASTGGTSGTTEPTWPLDEEDEISEGTSSPKLTWVESGIKYSTIYDLRRAAYDCWNLKAAKASQFIDAGDLTFHQVWGTCITMRNSYGSVVIA